MNYKILHKKYLLDTYPFRGKVFVRGEGNYLIDEEGERYLDLITNYGVNIFGYSNEAIKRGLTDQLDSITNLHGSFVSDIRARAAQQLVKRCAGKVSKVYFSNSGAEAVEAAIKFAVQASRKSKIVAAKGSFHGKTLGALSLTYSQKYKKDIEELLFDVEFVEYGDIGAIEEALNKDVAAVILEPIQGESGIIMPPVNYLREVEETCRDNSVLLILDEIQTGSGRTGEFLASHKYGVSADIICLGKGLAAGLPVGATLVSNDIAEKIPKLSQTSTFGGNPVTARGILLTLQELDEHKLERVADIGAKFRNKLSEILSDKIIEVRGEGLMIGIEVSEDRNEVLKQLQKNRILAGPAGDNVVRFLPPYTITKEEINKTVEIMELAV